MVDDDEAYSKGRIFSIGKVQVNKTHLRTPISFAVVFH